MIFPTLDAYPKVNKARNAWKKLDNKSQDNLYVILSSVVAIWQTVYYSSEDYQWHLCSGSGVDSLKSYIGLSAYGPDKCGK